MQKIRHFTKPIAEGGVLLLKVSASPPRNWEPVTSLHFTQETESFTPPPPPS